MNFKAINNLVASVFKQSQGQQWDRKLKKKTRIITNPFIQFHTLDYYI